MSDTLNRITAGAVLSAFDLNANWDSVELQTTQQGGQGVISGLVPTAGSGLSLNVSAGKCQSRRTVSIAGFAQNVPDNATNFVYLDWTTVTDPMTGATTYTGVLTFGGSSAAPTGKVTIGKVIAASGSISSVTLEGRIEIGRWISATVFGFGQLRIVIDEGAGKVGIGKAPTQGFLDIAGDVFTGAGNSGQGDLTVGGLLLPQEHIVLPWARAALAGTRTLTNRSANIQRMSCSGGTDRKVLLPDVSTVSAGYWFDIFNDNDGSTQTAHVLVRDHGDTTTICDLAPGKVAAVRPLVDQTGAVTWPASITSANTAGFAGF